MDVVYFTQNGHQAYLNKLSDKREEYLRVRDQRAEALQGTSEADMNDPELVDLQQQETTLNTAIIEIERILSQSRVVEIKDKDRPTSKVQIGSILEIQRINLTTDTEHPIEIWEIAGYDETNIKERLLSYNSPVGSSILGAALGDVISPVKIGDHEFEIEVIRLYKNWNEV